MPPIGDTALLRLLTFRTVDVVFEILGLDLLIGAVGTDFADCLIQGLAQIVVAFAYGNARAFTMVLRIAVPRSNEFEILAEIGLEEALVVPPNPP